jgi:hypothetical protein
MENDTEAKRLALEFIKRCRGEGRTIETIANAAGWILQIIAHFEAQRGSRTAVGPVLHNSSAAPDWLPKNSSHV